MILFVILVNKNVRMNLDKKQIVCTNCGKKEIDVDGLLRWNYEEQDWELIDVFNTGFCQNCSINSTHMEINNEDI